MNRDFTKREMKELRRLADSAYERELNDALEKLEADFHAWRSGQISPFELASRIHRFHDGESRDLWKVYNFAKPPISVARAIANGLLKETDLSPELLAQLTGAIDFYRRDWHDADDHGGDDQ